MKISEEEGERSIKTGLVIKDAKGNEFLWIPVTTDLEYSYSYNNDSTYNEPYKLTEFDSQGTLDSLYETDYYNYSDFKYEDEYKEMIDSVNEHNGFY